MTSKKKSWDERVRDAQVAAQLAGLVRLRRETEEARVDAAVLRDAARQMTMFDGSKAEAEGKALAAEFRHRELSRRLKEVEGL